MPKKDTLIHISLTWQSQNQTGTKGNEFPIESNHYFAFIMGYTSGGAAYGITHEEWRNIQKEEKNYSTKT